MGSIHNSITFQREVLPLNLLLANPANVISPAPKKSIMTGSVRVISLTCPINGEAETQSSCSVVNEQKKKKIKTKDKQIENINIFLPVKTLIAVY
jgi:hypothetical protein